MSTIKISVNFLEMFSTLVKEYNKDRDEKTNFLVFEVIDNPSTIPEEAITSAVLRESGSDFKLFRFDVLTSEKETLSHEFEYVFKYIFNYWLKSLQKNSPGSSPFNTKP